MRTNMGARRRRKKLMNITKSPKTLSMRFVLRWKGRLSFFNKRRRKPNVGIIAPNTLK